MLGGFWIDLDGFGVDVGCFCAFFILFFGGRALMSRNVPQVFQTFFFH